MKKMFLVCAMSCAIVLLSSCEKENVTCSCNHSNNLETDLTTEQLLLGSWVVSSNHYTYNGETRYDWDNTLVGEYWKFCNEGTEKGNLYRDGSLYCTYLVIGDSIYFGNHVSVIHTDGPSYLADKGRFAIKDISSSKLKLASEWGSENNRSIIEFNRL